MKPVEFEGQTLLLGPPEGSRRGACGALPVLKAADDAFGTRFVSYWRPSPEDLAVLNAGGHVELQVCGAGHPPVWVDVSSQVAELP